MPIVKNTQTRFSLVAILIHWLTAVVIIGLFLLGSWMVDLDYYSEWYRTGPDIHRSVGVLLFMVLVLRLLLRLFSPPPKPLPGVTGFERVAAVMVHWLLYVLVLVTTVTGYLISTADGRAVDVFGLFAVPATITSIADQEDVSGELHYYFAVAILVVAGIHALAALKHHFVDKDATLKRMLGIHSRTDS